MIKISPRSKAIIPQLKIGQQQQPNQQQHNDNEGKVFGAKLPPTNFKTPEFVIKCLALLEKIGLDEEGLFRVPGDRSHVNILREKLNKGETVDLMEIKSVHTLASLIKMYFRELQEPLLTFEYYDLYISADGIPEPEARKSCINKLIQLLPQSHFELLRLLCLFLYKVSLNKASNKMGAPNLAIVFAPNLLRREHDTGNIAIEDVKYANGITATLVSDAPFFFAENGSDRKPVDYVVKAQVEEDIRQSIQVGSNEQGNGSDFDDDSGDEKSDHKQSEKSALAKLKFHGKFKRKTTIKRVEMDTSWITITFLKGRNMVKKKTACDAFCSLYLLNSNREKVEDTKFRSQVVEGCEHPVWNEEFAMNIDFNTQAGIRIRCWDHETFVKNQIIGEADILFSELKNLEVKTMSLTLKKEHKDGKNPDKECSRAPPEIQVQIKLVNLDLMTTDEMQAEYDTPHNPAFFTHGWELMHLIMHKLRMQQEESIHSTAGKYVKPLPIPNAQNRNNGNNTNVSISPRKLPQVPSLNLVGVDGASPRKLPHSPNTDDIPKISPRLANKEHIMIISPRTIPHVPNTSTTNNNMISIISPRKLLLKTTNTNIKEETKISPQQNNTGDSQLRDNSKDNTIKIISPRRVSVPMSAALNINPNIIAVKSVTVTHTVPARSESPLTKNSLCRSQQKISSSSDDAAIIPYEQLKNTSTLPPGVDIKKREVYMSDVEFNYVFGMTKEQFYALPLWKQIHLKKSHNLF